MVILDAIRGFRKGLRRALKDVAKAGSILLLAADSFAMAKHAAEKGFISPEALAEVLAERMREDETALRLTTSVRRSTPGETPQ